MSYAAFIFGRMQDSANRLIAAYGRVVSCVLVGIRLEIGRADGRRPCLAPSHRRRLTGARHGCCPAVALTGRGSWFITHGDDERRCPN
jgi:hypothetical protein